MMIVSSALLIITGVYLALGLIYLRFRVDERSRREFSAHTRLRTSLLAVRWLQNIAKQRDALVFRSRPFFVFLLLAIAVPGFCQAVAANDSQKRVLILAGDSNDFPAVAKMDEGFRRTLTASSPFRLSYYRETLDVSRIRISDFESGLVEYLQQKYQFQQPDLIVMIGAATIRFMAKHEQALFAGVPKVLIYYDRSQLAQHESDLPRSVSIVSKIEIGPTLDIILTQNPGTKRVVVVTGDPSGDRRWLDLAEKDLAPYADRIEFEQTGGLTMDDLRSKLAELPPNTPILFISSPPDSSGNLMNVAEGSTMIAPSANAPVYSILDTSMGNGVLGGQVLSFESMGIRAAEVGQRILAGEEPKNIPQQDVPTVPMFDWRQLKRWGISEASLPPGSIVQFRQPTVWEEYKWYAIGLLAALVVETILIGLLLYLRLRRRQAETKAERLSGRLAEIVANVPGIVWESRTDPDDNVRKTTFISDYVEQMLGYSSEEWLAGQPGFGFRIVPQDERERVKRELDEVGETGQPSVMEYPWRGKDGRSRWVRNHVTPLLDEEKRIIGLRGVALDITERHAAQQVLLEREARLAETLDQLQLSAAAANVGLWTRKVGDEKIWLSERAADVWGLPSGKQIKREDIFERIHAADRGPYIRNIQELEEWKNEYQMEYRFVGEDGGTKWIHSRGKVETENGWRIIRGAIVDITQLKIAEQAVRESEERFRNMADDAPMMIWVSGTDKLCTYFNRGWLDFTGRTMEQELGDQWAEGVHPDDRAHCLEVYNSHFDQRKGFEMEYRLQRFDGEYRWTVDRGTPRFTPQGEFLGYIGTSIDITERKMAESELKQAHGELKKLKDQLEAENIYLQEELLRDGAFGEIVGESAAVKNVLRLISQVAPTDSTVLIMGETGTGKELLARAIHESSLRKDRPLIRVNCAALSPSLIESELFGHEKGAFTGAGGRRLGRFELAHTGTLFLDEIGELPLDLQSKLLRVLQEGEIERVGGSKTIKVDVRIIAATNRDLKQAVKNGTFREDLWYRLNIFPIKSPPLRDRRDDIPILADHFATIFALKYGKKLSGISRETMSAFCSYSWPGNIRELANVVEREVINLRGTVLRIHEDLESRNADATTASLKTLEELERQHILKVLEELNWRVEGPRGAASVLDVNASTLRSRIRKLGINKTKSPHEWNDRGNHPS